MKVDWEVVLVVSAIATLIGLYGYAIIRMLPINGREWSSTNPRGVLRIYNRKGECVFAYDFDKDEEVEP